MSGCYVPKSVEQSEDYQGILKSREDACKADIREFDQWEWDFLKKDFPGIPLKHLVDDLTRHGEIPHDLNCPNASHSPFFIKWFGENCHNEI